MTARRFADDELVMIGDDEARFFDNAGTLEVDFGAGTDLKKGIWKVDGDTLLICESRPGGPRPTEFTAPADSLRLLLIFKRVSE